MVERSVAAYFLALALSLCLVPSLTKSEEYQIPDDGYAYVPLEFAFPYYGQLFTDSYMFSNGVVGFVSPTNAFCCDAFDLTRPDQSFNFSLFVLQTDLIDNGPGTFTAVGDSSSMTYSWNNISEYGTNNLNSFSASIYATGQIDYNYTNINLTYHSATIGMTGDTSLGENQTYETIQPNTYRNITSTVSPATGVNFCESDPLYDIACPGYAEAYFLLQCSYDPLYDQQCEGYQNAYYSQQCYNNALYDQGCPGHAEAYYKQQCSIDPLYDSGCDGYTEAYDAYTLNQVCTANAQADPRCPGYTVTEIIETATDTTFVSFTDPITGSVEELSMGTLEPQAEPEVTETVSDTPQTETREQTAKEAKTEAKAAVKEMASAKSIEAQQKAQSSVLAMLGYVPGFGAYSVSMDGGSYADVPFYQPTTLPESKSAVRNGLAQQVLHTKMIMQQYEEQ